MKLFICFAAFGCALGKPLEFEIANEPKFFLDENPEERLTDFDTEFEKTLNGIEEMIKSLNDKKKIQEIMIHEMLDRSFNEKNRKNNSRRQSQGWENIMF